MALEIKGVSVQVRGRTLVHGIDASAHSGEITALIGPNGAGAVYELCAAVCARIRPWGAGGAGAFTQTFWAFGR